jgi:inosine triphosphate pyrophosphatase
MLLNFITGNRNKFDEVAAIVPGLVMMDLDLPEIQETDPKAVIVAKLKEATAHHDGAFIVEDTSLTLDCLGGRLPGPLIKWFLQTLGNDGLHELCARFGDFGVEARTLIGLAEGHDDIHFFEGVRRGTIVAPRGDKDFGWGPIFQPDGETRTFGELDREEKHALSMRGEAARKLAEFLTHG